MTRADPAEASTPTLLALRRRQLRGALALLAVIAVSVTAAFAFVQRDATEQEALREVALYARVLEDQVTRALTTVSSMQRSLSQRGTLRRSPVEPQPAERLLEQQLIGQPFLRSLAVVDRSGRIVASTVEGEAGLRIDLRVLGWQEQETGRDLVGPLLPIRELGQLAHAGGTADVAALPLLRAIPMEDGAPPLWLVSLVNPDHFTTQHEIIVADTHVRATLADLRGRVLSTTGAPVGGERTLVALPPFTRFLPERESGAYIGEGAEGAAAVAAFRMSRQWPMLVLAEFPLADARAAWRDQVLPAVGLCAVLLVLLASLGVVADRGLLRQMRSLAREAKLARDLAEAEERWKLALEGAGHGVWDVDLVAGRATLSPRLAELLGPAPDGGAWTDAQLRAAVHPDDVEAVSRALDEHLRGQSPRFTHEMRVRGADDGWHWLQASATRVDTGEGRTRRRRLIGTATDISARKDAELALRDSEARQQAILRSALDGIVSVDAEGRIIGFNPAAEAIFGRSAADVLGQPMHEMIMPQRHRAAHVAGMERYLATGHGPVLNRRIEVEALRADGEVFPIEMAITPVVVDGSEMFTATVRDISERHRTEQARLEAERALAEARQRELQVGARIQQSLLVTPTPPDLNGLQISSFSQASQGIDGDFVEVLRVGPHCVDIIAGDVMGKGLPAAMMGTATKLQFSRSMAELLVSADVDHTQIPRPAEVVAAVHRAMTPALQQLEAFVTLCYLRIDMQRRVVTWVGCGHEETQVVGRDTVTLLANQHPPLGVLDDPDYTDSEQVLYPGDALFLCSDGVTDALRGDGQRVGRTRVAEAVARRVALHESPAAVLHAVRSDLLAGGVRVEDDVTLLLVQLPAGDERVRRIELPPRLDAIRRLRGFVDGELAGMGLGEAEAGLLCVACVEAFTNIVRHATGLLEGSPVEVVMRRLGRDLELDLVYQGDAYRPPEDPPETELDSFPEGGFGLHIMRGGTDWVDHLHQSGVNTVRLSKRLP